MICEFCGGAGIHLCAGRIKAYNDSLTPEQREQQRSERMESLQRAIDAGKVLREHGIVLVCNQRNIDYLESRTCVDDLDTDLIR